MKDIEIKTRRVGLYLEVIVTVDGFQAQKAVEYIKSHSIEEIAV